MGESILLPMQTLTLSVFNLGMRQGWRVVDNTSKYCILSRSFCQDSQLGSSWRRTILLSSWEWRMLVVWKRWNLSHILKGAGESIHWKEIYASISEIKEPVQREVYRSQWNQKHRIKLLMAPSWVLEITFQRNVQKPEWGISLPTELFKTSNLLRKELLAQDFARLQ